MLPAWKELMNEARALAEVDLVLKNAQLVNVLSGEIHQADIGIHRGRFVGIGDFDQAKQVMDLSGKFVVPGLIDGHVHIESSHLCPEEFCSVLLAHGVTSAVVDPHEIANVHGTKGIQYILDAVEPLPFNAYVALPSCVPATGLETSGATLEAADLARFVTHPRVIALGEVMDFPSVLTSQPQMAAKLDLPLRLRDGHAPGISSQDLNAYYLAGIRTEHECSTVEEARERLRRGFAVMLRQGSAAHNLLDLLPVVNPENSRQCMLVTDDRHCSDLLAEGSIDHLVRLAIQAGAPPVRVIQMATINTARTFGLDDLGAIAPGYQADFVVLDDLERFEINQVYWQGRLVSEQGVIPQFEHLATDGLDNSINIGDWNINKLEVRIQHAIEPETERLSVKVIGVQTYSLVTSALRRELPVEGGIIQTDPEQGVIKIAVLERHHGSGRVGLGFVEGLGLKRGAVASTVAHDSHNMVVVGATDAEMDLAIRTCVEMGGGLCLVDGEQVIGRLPLPISGLMAGQSPSLVDAGLRDLHAKARQLGVTGDVDPFMNLAFLSLPVIPELKISDLGLVDVEHFCLTDLA